MSWGSIGPRRPMASGENCLNCGMMFIMEPGYKTNEDGMKMATWKCNGCGRVEEWAVGRDPDFRPQEMTSKDIIK